MARELPKITWKGKVWFLDERLKQIRNVENPSDFLSFEEWDAQPEGDEEQG